MLAAVIYNRGFDTDALLLEACTRLKRDGVRVGGLLQLATGEDDGACAKSIHVIDLRTSHVFNIWEDRGSCAKGCRLDENGLAMAEPVLARAVREPVDLLVINRFGRAESLGRGLRHYCEQALAAGVPVLTAVREPYVNAWRSFHGGLGVELAAEENSILRWCADTPQSTGRGQVCGQLSC